MVTEVTRRQWRKSIYLDGKSYEAFLFLKVQAASSGLRFSVPALFRQFLAMLHKKPHTVLTVSGWKRRSSVHGKRLVIPLGFPIKDELARLERYYTAYAKTTRRVRDGVPKQRRLPISQLFAHYVRSKATALGWKDEGVDPT